MRHRSISAVPVARPEKTATTMGPVSAGGLRGDSGLSAGFGRGAVLWLVNAVNADSVLQSPAQPGVELRRTPDEAFGFCEELAVPKGVFFVPCSVEAVQEVYCLSVDRPALLVSGEDLVEHVDGEEVHDAGDDQSDSECVEGALPPGSGARDLGGDVQEGDAEAYEREPGVQDAPSAAVPESFHYQGVECGYPHGGSVPRLPVSGDFERRLAEQGSPVVIETL